MVAPIIYYACSGSQLNKHRLWEKWDQGDSTSPVSSDDFFQKCREYPRVDERGGKARMCFIRKELSEVDIEIHALMRLQLFYCCAKQYYGTGKIALGDETFLQEFHPDKQEGEQDAHHSLFGYLCDDSFLKMDSWNREKILSLWKDAGKSNFDQFTELMRKPNDDWLTLNNLTQNVFALLENLPQDFAEIAKLLKQRVEEGKSIKDLKQFVKGLDEGDLKRNLGLFLQTFGTQDMQERRWKELLLAILARDENTCIAELLRCYMPRWSILEQSCPALIFAMNHTMSAPAFVNAQDTKIENKIRKVAMQRLNAVVIGDTDQAVLKACAGVAQSILQNLKEQETDLQGDLTKHQLDLCQTTELLNDLLQKFDEDPYQTIIEILSHRAGREINRIMENINAFSRIAQKVRIHFNNIRDNKEGCGNSYEALRSYLKQESVLERVNKSLGSSQNVDDLESLKKMLKDLLRKNEGLFYEIIVREFSQVLLKEIRDVIEGLRNETEQGAFDIKLLEEQLKMIQLQENGTQQFLGNQIPFDLQEFSIAFCEQCNK